MKKTIEAYFEALERFDLEAAADCFTDDVFYSHPPYSGEGSRRHEVRGRAGLIGLFEQRGHKPDVQHDVQLAVLDGSHGAVGGTFTSGGVTGSFLSTVTMS